MQTVVNLNPDRDKRCQALTSVLALTEMGKEYAEKCGGLDRETATAMFTAVGLIAEQIESEVQTNPLNASVDETG